MIAVALPPSRQNREAAIQIKTTTYYIVLEEILCLWDFQPDQSAARNGPLR